ncbi:MAG: AMP-binding protein, partial [Myxococcota bacterium]
MTHLTAALDAHREAVASFRWQEPPLFNFGSDVVDAQDPEAPALFWRSAAGGERRLAFGEVSAGSNRVAHLLRALGVGPGEPVLVML